MILETTKRCLINYDTFLQYNNMQLLKKKGNLFTAAKIQKQPEHPSRDEWIVKMWYGILSSLNKEVHPAICDNMNGLR